MKIIKKINKPVFIISLVVFLFSTFYKPPLPKTKDVLETIKTIPPLQEEIVKEIKNQDIRGQHYKVTNLYNYEIYGLVVEDYDSENWLDITHENDPAQTKDLCLIWGDNAKNGSYLEVKFKHGEFTCFYSWKGKLKNHFTGSQLSNNHLIPSNEEVYQQIKNTKIGDQVYIKGKLINYKILDEDGKEISYRNTSTTRKDNLCEIIYVEDYKILKRTNLSLEIPQKISKYVLIISGMLGLILFFL